MTDQRVAQVELLAQQLSKRLRKIDELMNEVWVEHELARDTFRQLLIAHYKFLAHEGIPHEYWGYLFLLMLLTMPELLSGSIRLEAQELMSWVSRHEGYHLDLYANVCSRIPDYEFTQALSAQITWFVIGLAYKGFIGFIGE